MNGEIYYKLFNQTTGMWYLTVKSTTFKQEFSYPFRSQKLALAALSRMANRTKLQYEPDTNDINSAYGSDWILMMFESEAVSTDKCLLLVNPLTVKKNVSEAVKRGTITPVTIAKLKRSGIL